MLKISKSQMELFQSSAHEGFRLRLVQFLSREMPDTIDRWSGAEKLVLVERYASHAMRLGIKTEQGIAMFVSLSFALECSVDEVPEVRDYLKAPGRVDVEERLEQLVDLLP